MENIFVIHHFFTLSWNWILFNLILTCLIYSSCILYRNLCIFVLFMFILIRTRHGTDWFKIGKGVCQDCILAPCLFNLYTEYIMQNAQLDEEQAWIKIARRSHNHRYVDNTTLMAEREEELKSLLMKVKEGSEEKGLKLNIQKKKIMASNPVTSWQMDGGKHGNSDRLFSWAPKSLWMLTAATKVKDACSLEEKLWQT